MYATILVRNVEFRHAAATVANQQTRSSEHAGNQGTSLGPGAKLYIIYPSFETQDHSFVRVPTSLRIIQCIEKKTDITAPYYWYHLW